MTIKSKFVDTENLDKLIGNIEDVIPEFTDRDFKSVLTGLIYDIKDLITESYTLEEVMEMYEE